MTDPYVSGHGDATYDVTHYAIDLAVKLEGNRLDGEARLSCVARERLPSFDLDLAHLRPSRVTVDGRPAKYTHRGTRLLVRPAQPIADGAGFEVRVKYAGQPKPIRLHPHDDAGWEELTDGVIVAAQPHGAPSWFPGNDRPDNKATYSITVSVPAGYRVAASGELRSSRRSGASTVWVHEQPSPMPTYLATVQIGRYDLTELPGAPVPVRVVAPEGVVGSGGFAAAFAEQPAMLTFFASLFGDYPFESYTCVITDDDLEIPLESQGLSTFGRNFLSDDWECVRLVAHELAHQWFGNAVTLREWRDIWLHEGFACYAEWLWSQECGLASTDDRAARHFEKLEKLDQDILVGDPGPELMFDDRVYKRGALTLHALRKRVGDDAFFDLLRSWVSGNSGGSVSTVDFVLHCEQAAGEDLSGLFEDWLFTERLPELPL